MASVGLPGRSTVRNSSTRPAANAFARPVHDRLTKADQRRVRMVPLVGTARAAGSRGRLSSTSSSATAGTMPCGLVAAQADRGHWTRTYSKAARWRHDIARDGRRDMSAEGKTTTPRASTAGSIASRESSGCSRRRCPRDFRPSSRAGRRRGAHGTTPGEPEAVAPGDLLTLLVRSAVIGDGQLVDAQSTLENLRRDLWLDAESLLPQVE